MGPRRVAKRKLVALNHDSDAESEEEEYEVEEILAKKQNSKTKKVQYLIKRKGYDANKSTWETEEHIKPGPILNKFIESERQKTESAQGNNVAQGRQETKPSNSYQSFSERKNVKATVFSNKYFKHNDAVCPVCFKLDDLGRKCDVSSSRMHHYCSHEICMSLKLKDANGEDKIDFGD